MLKIIIISAIILSGLFIYSCLVVASDSDDKSDEMLKRKNDK